MIKFTLLGSPRTKKNSSRLVTIPGKKKECTPGQGAHSECDEFDCVANDRERGFTKILPSEAFEEWEKEVLLQRGRILGECLKQGAQLPIRTAVHVKALFFRDRNTGDLAGYEQALADVLQAQTYRYTCRCGKSTISGAQVPSIKCRHCPQTIRSAPKINRKGMGIIADDVQIVSWDGTRLRVDRDRPRVEVHVEEFGDVQGSLY